MLAVLQDFDQFQNIYKPEIVRSQVLSHSGGTYHVSFRLHKDTPWVNPTFNVDSTVTVARLDATHACIRSVSTRIAQIENAGKPDEHEDSPGHDSGYLWRFDTFWRLEARPGGVARRASAGLSAQRPPVERLHHLEPADGGLGDRFGR